MQRIGARAIDAYEFEFACRYDHEADWPSAYGAGNRSYVSLHGRACAEPT
jgi:hypothetical protein